MPLLSVARWWMTLWTDGPTKHVHCGSTSAHARALCECEYGARALGKCKYGASVLGECEYGASVHVSMIVSMYEPVL
jgi:hypothetical protein